MDDKIREKLAALCHEQWSGWMKYLFSESKYRDGGAFILPEDAKRWYRQMNCSYNILSEREKDSDRKQADKIIKLLDMEKEKEKFFIPEHPLFGVVEVVCKRCGEELHHKSDFEIHKKGECKELKKEENK